MSEHDGQNEQRGEAAAPPSTAEPAADNHESPARAPAAKPRRARPRDPALARAFRSGRPVSGKVVGVIKGGYEVRVGRSRAFCPHSQIELHRVEDPESMVGRDLQFKISQFRRGGEDVVVSRRAVLEEEQADEAKAVRAALLEGSVLQGKVAGTAEFGAFIDLGAGVMGLVHISELSHGHVDKVEDVVKVGDTLTVKILKLHERGKISLSARQAEADPWADVDGAFAPGTVCRGTVLRVAEFGAFVELRPGVEALAPAREFPPRPEGWADGLEPGREMEWVVLSVSRSRRRVSLAPAPEDGAPATAPTLEPGTVVEGRVQKVERYGVFVWMGPGRVGLMPNIWSGEKRGVDLAQRFSVGSGLEVEVVEVAEGGRRIRLARKGHAPKEPEPARESRVRRPPRAAEPAPEPPAEASSFGTSLADKLRAALDRRER